MQACLHAARQQDTLYAQSSGLNVRIFRMYSLCKTSGYSHSGTPKILLLIAGRRSKCRRAMVEGLRMNDFYFMGPVKNTLMPSVSKTLTGGSVAFMGRSMAKVGFQLFH